MTKRYLKNNNWTLTIYGTRTLLPSVNVSTNSHYVKMMFYLFIYSFVKYDVLLHAVSLGLQPGVLPLNPGPLYAIDGDSGINEPLTYSILTGE